MKTLELLAALGTKETKLFEKNIIKSHKRGSLVRLYNYLKKHSASDKEQIFVKVFQRKYSSKQDNLLRNELRLLNKEIEAFLVELQWQKKKQSDPDVGQLLLLESYFERQEAYLFEQQWRKLYRKAKEEQDLALLIDLVKRYFSYHTLYSNIEVELYQQLATLLEESLVAIASLAQEDYEREALYYGFLQRNLWAMNGGDYERKKTPVLVEHLQKNPSNPIATFYRQANDSCYYLNTSEAKVEQMKKAVALADKLEDHPRHEQLQERIQNLKASLALEHYILKRFEEADKLYQPLVAPPIYGSLRTKSSLTFNYFTNLLGLEAYERAIALYEEWAVVWASFPHLAYKGQHMVCWAYHETKQYEKALDLLLDNKQHYSVEGDLVYSRIMIGITYFVLEEYEFAERELYNLLQNNRYRNYKEDVPLGLSKFIYQYFLAYHQVDKDKRHAKFLKIQEELEVFYQSHASFASTFIYRWLSQHLETSIG